MDIRHALNLAHTFMVNAENATSNGFQEGKRLLDEAVTLIRKGYHLGAPLRDLIQKHGAAANVPPAPISADSAPEELSAALAVAEADKAVAEGNVSSLQARLDAASVQITEQATAIATLQAQVVNLSDASKAAAVAPGIDQGSELAALQTKNDQLTANLAEAVKAVSDDNAEIARLQSLAADLQAQLSAVNAAGGAKEPEAQPRDAEGNLILPPTETVPSEPATETPPAPEQAGALDSASGLASGPVAPSIIASGTENL